jgi:hypothetical protein
MKKLIIGLIGAVLVSGAVYAGVNIKQDADGGATWEYQAGSTIRTYAIGRQVLQARITDLSTASSEYIYVPEAGIVTAVYCTLGAAITGADATISVADGVSAAAFTTLTVTQSGSAIGNIDSSTGLSESIDAGAVLTVGTNGQSTTTAVENCVIFVDTN